MASEAPREKWVQWVALTTTVLAVCAVIASLRAGTFSTRMQLATTDENNAWAYFQAKSIKQHVSETQRDLMRIYAVEARTPQARALAQRKLSECAADIARYDTEKAQIKVDAEQKARTEADYKRHSAATNLGVMLLQLGIMLSSVSALVKVKAVWALGGCFGTLGLVYVANGFFLWF